jgi:hypothetical protein
MCESRRYSIRLDVDALLRRPTSAPPASNRSLDQSIIVIIVFNDTMTTEKISALDRERLIRAAIEGIWCITSALS